MYLLLVFFPLLNSIFSGLCGRWLGRQGIVFISLFTSASSFFLACFAFYEVAFNKSVCLLSIDSWLTTEIALFYWGFLFDTLTCVMLVVVTFISMLVHLYSTEYMSQDPHLPRFMAYLSFFTFFMLILVTADNLLQMFVGWEGVGLCSYLLINFWYGRIQANKAALKAMFINRIGDFGLAIGLFTIFAYMHTLDYSIIFALAPQFANETITFLPGNIALFDFVGFFLFIGAVGKSAQIGLHTWLPDAMEGPTPVSALIHAATMVTAGVFLLCRMSPLLQYAPNVSFIIVIMGGMTAFLAATTGLLQNDLKRVIAYSTCSQLGYMVFAAGLSSYNVSMFHLSNHAFFKALLFLSAGSIIHALSDEQDMRQMGGLLKILPVTYVSILVGSMALMGFPFLTGFYSKDIILEVAYGSFTLEGRFAYTVGILAAFFTAYYSIRLIALTFLRPTNTVKVSVEHAHESALPMLMPLIILCFASIFVGFLGKDMFIGMGTDFWGNSLFVLPSKQYLLESEWLETNIKLIPLFFTLAGISLAVFFYLIAFKLLFIYNQFYLGRLLYTFLNRKWFFDKVYNSTISEFILKISYRNTYQMMDRGMLEFFGPNGISNIIYSVTKPILHIKTSMIFHYLFMMFFFLSLILFVCLEWMNILVDLRLISLLVIIIASYTVNHTIFKQN